MSAARLGEECSEEVRAVDRFRVVAIPGDTVIVRSPLVLAGGVLGSHGGIAGDDAGGGRRRHVA